MKTQYSRRELYAAGEPLGESATRVVAGRRIYGGGGGGSSLQPMWAKTGAEVNSNTSSTPQTPSGINPMTQSDTQQGIAGYAQPYVNTMLGATMQNLFNYDQSGNATGMKGYTPYSSNPADYVAGFSPMQQQAQQGVAGLQLPGQFGQASDYANQATQGLLNQQYNPVGAGYSNVNAPNLQNYQMSGPQQVNTQQFTGNQVGQYMNPYLQNALQPQLQEMQRQYDITGAQEAGNATKQGAFGGSRQAIMQAENQRNKNTAMNQAIGQGYNTAYNNAANQFNTSQGQNLQAQMANQGAGLTAGTQNLNALLGVQSLGAGQNMQSQLANQQAQQNANQLAANQQQFGANYGMQGKQAALSGANTLGNLGTSQLGAQQGIYGLQNTLGQQQQQQQQNIINQGVQNYQTAQQYPMQQLNQMKGILSGLPVGTTSTQGYQAAPTNLQNLLALGMGSAGISKLLGGGSGGSGGSGGGFDVSGLLNKGAGAIGDAGSWINNNLLSGYFAEGGEVKGYKQGGVTSEENVASIANFLPTPQLPKSLQAAQGRGDVDAEDALQKEMAERASIQRGLGSAFNQLPQGAQQNVFRAAGGGVVAFATGGLQDTLDDLTSVGEQDISVTPEKRVQGIQALAPQVQKMFGPSKTAGLAEEIAQERADLKSGKNMDQGYGIGLLKAAQAVLKPGGAMRGLGDAGAAFGDEVLKMEKENREANRLLRQSQITLAAADQAREDGLVGKAGDLFNLGQTEKKDALARKAGVLEKKATIQAGVENAKLQAQVAREGHAVTREGYARPGETERMLGELDAIRTGKKNFQGLTGEEGAKAYQDAVGQLGAARYGVKYTGPNKDFEHRKAVLDVLQKDEGVKIAQMKVAQLEAKDKLSAKEQAALNANKAFLQKRYESVSTDLQKTGGAPTGGAPTGSKNVLSMADIQRTAEVSGKSIEEVRAAAAAKGYTIQ